MSILIDNIKTQFSSNNIKTEITKINSIKSFTDTKKLLLTILHIINAGSLCMATILSNNIFILTVLLIIFSILKIGMFIHKRCLLTLFEYNKTYNIATEIFRSMIVDNITDKQGEEIFINFLTIIILLKLSFLIFIKYYKITFFNNYI